MKVHAIQCPKCFDIIYSRARHDCHHCSCGSCMIDGGFDYQRGGFDPKVGEPISVVKIIKATKKELYDDWNKFNSPNKFGTIKQKSLTKRKK